MISLDFITKQINKINIKKATGRDGISAKILKIAKPVIAKPISHNISIFEVRGHGGDSQKP
jgi:hypothetical protein